MKDRRVVISGAGRGLGRALAITAADRGAEAVLLGRDAQALAQVAEEIRRRTGRACETIHCDLARPASVSQACQRILDAAPAVDVLINNGAPWLPGRLDALSDADIAATIAGAVTGAILLTKGLLPGLRRSRAADVVTIVSTAGLRGHRIEGAASAAFHAAKHGQAGFSERLRGELQGDGIRVCAIYPPDFDDTDPLSAAWNETRDPATGAKLTNREVVAAVMFAITAPRVCSCPEIVLGNTADVRA